jgi:hypothetical protein
MIASETRSFHIGRWIALLLTAIIAFWYYGSPQVSIFYSKDGTKDVSYILNTQHRILKGELKRGQITGDAGHIFPTNEFFMEFYWWRDNERRHCVSITPKWPDTHVYLDADGNIDTSDGGGTDVGRLKECELDSAKP